MSPLRGLMAWDVTSWLRACLIQRNGPDAQTITTPVKDALEDSNCYAPALWTTVVQPRLAWCSQSVRS